MATGWRRWRQELRGTFTAHADGVPPWVQDLAEGHDAGHFGPGSAAWAVHGSMTPLVAGIHALLVQALHPGALAGVHEHSDYREAPLARLDGTIRWIFTVTYGDTVAAASASARVGHIHTFVTGRYTDAWGTERPYAASDPELLRWVHLAFTEAFLSAHRCLGGRIPGGPDAYVADWAVAGDLMHVPSPPRTVAELEAQLAEFTPALRYDARVAETLAFLRHPPLPRSQRRGYAVLFAAAVATLPPEYRTLLRLQHPHWGPLPLPVLPVARGVLGIVHLGLGRRSPSEQAARARRRRLGVEGAFRNAR